MSMDELFDTTEVTPGIGHNMPPSSVGGIEEAKQLAARAAEMMARWLEARDAALIERITSLLEAADKRFPKKITSEVEAEKASDFRAQINTAVKAAETLRKTDKAAFEVPAKAVHTFWTKQTDALEAASNKVGGVLKAYLVEKQAKIDEANRKAAEKQAKAAAEAAAKNKPAPLPAPAPPSPAPVRARGDMGSMSSLQKRWTFENLDRKTVDLEALRPYLADVAVDAAIRAFIAAGHRELKGCDIVERSVLSTR